MTLVHDGERRIGQFYIYDRFLRGQDAEEMQLVTDLLSGAFIMECRFDYSAQSFYYIALHPQFKFIPSSEDAPLYFTAWQGTRLVFVEGRPEDISFDCPSKHQYESWKKTMEAKQREHPTKHFLPCYP